MTVRENPVWTREALARLDDLVCSGLSHKAIGQLLGKSRVAITQAAARHRIYSIRSGYRQDFSLALALDDVSARFGLSKADLRGPSRQRYIAHARQEFMYLANKAGRSLPQIGLFLGGRHHTTVLHGVRAHEGRTAA